jgi:hypothetical protein
MNFPYEFLCKGLVTYKIDRFHFAHEVAMVIAVTVVVAKYTAIILRALPEINVREAVSDNFAMFKPDLLLQDSPFSFAPEAMHFNARRSNRLGESLHHLKDTTDRIRRVLSAGGEAGVGFEGRWKCATCTNRRGE